MANTPQARKRVRQNRKLNVLRSGQRSMARTLVGKVRKAVSGGDINLAKKEYLATEKVLDRLAAKKVYHPNKSARLKSRLAALIKSRSAQPKA